MKTMGFVIFFSIFFTIYGLVNYYLFIRGWQALADFPHLRKFYLPVFLFFSLAFIAGRFLERAWLSPVSDLLVWVGSFWLAAMLYFFLIIFVLDWVRLLNHFMPFFSKITPNYAQLKFVTFASVVSLVILIILGGHINALQPRIRRLELTLPKTSSVETVHIVAASDVHLGTIIGRRRFCKIVEKINALNPELILFAGDIFDEDLGAVIKQNGGEALEALRAKWGVYAITGNHEYIGGVEAATNYLQKHKIHVLRDSVVKINDALFLVGRDDRTSNRFGHHPRKSLAELMEKVDSHYPVILMDHQPFELAAVAEFPVDLQLSGHTHHGQMWPLNYITRAIYELSWGYMQIKNTHFYVSSGVGTWGPPVRTGSRPEIVDIYLNFR